MIAQGGGDGKWRAIRLADDLSAPERKRQRRRIFRDFVAHLPGAAAQPGIAGVQVYAEPLGHRAVRCATSNPDGSYTIELDAAGTYLVAPSAAPAGMQLTTKGFRLPVVMRQGQQVQDVDFGYR